MFTNNSIFKETCSAIFHNNIRQQSRKETFDKYRKPKLKNHAIEILQRSKQAITDRASRLYIATFDQKFLNTTLRKELHRNLQFY